jgi:hypothetical protein
MFRNFIYFKMINLAVEEDGGDPDFLLNLQRLGPVRVDHCQEPIRQVLPVSVISSFSYSSCMNQRVIVIGSEEKWRVITTGEPHVLIGIERIVRGAQVREYSWGRCTAGG